MILPGSTGALITDPALVIELNTVLNQPVHLQPPALRHFLQGGHGTLSASSDFPPTPSRSATAGTANWLDLVPAVLLSTFVVGSGITVLIWALWPLWVKRRQRLSAFLDPRRRRIGRAFSRSGLRSVDRRPAAAVVSRPVRAAPPRTRRPIYAATAIVALAAIGITVGRAAAHPSPDGVRAPAIAVDSHPGARPASTATAAATTPWFQLVAIERAVASRQQQLAVEEDRITNLATSAAGHEEPPARGSGADRRAATASGALVILLETHQQTVNAYQQSLQDEYDFYVSAAKATNVRAALTQSAAADPAVSTVVQYDLQQVSTQLQQEQTIATAQAASAAQAQQQIAANTDAPSFSAPVGGYVSQGFGPTPFVMELSLTYHGVFYTHFHTGIDIANALDMPVVAAAPGRVIVAGDSRDASGNLVGYGHYVVIDHGRGYITLYAHLDKIVASTGQLVQRGQEIGLLGTTGWSTGPHLHFEIRHDGDFVDPETLLGNAVRAG